MCGLVGIAGKLQLKDESTMKKLFLLDYFRGPDSTGLAAIRANGDAHIAKLPSHPLDLFDSMKFKSSLNGIASIAFIGHNRAATRGVVNHTNAHPYQSGHIIGAHNGTLFTDTQKALEELSGEKFATDSAAIFAAIAAVGIEKTMAVMETGSNYSTGAWSLVWFDQEKGTLNFLRNKHRPMWYSFNEECDRIFWASEWPMIDSAIKLGNGDHKLFMSDKGHRFWSTEEDVLYTFDVNKLKAGSKERPKAVVKKMPGGKETPVVSNVTTYPFSQKEGSTTTWPARTPGSTTVSPTLSVRERKEPQVIQLLGTSIDPYAGYYDKFSFKRMAEYGCSFCNKKVEFGTPGILIFQKENSFLCPDCCCVHDDSTRIIVQKLPTGVK